LCYNLVESIEFDSVVLVQIISVMGSVDALDQLWEGSWSFTQSL